MKGCYVLETDFYDQNIELENHRVKLIPFVDDVAEEELNMIINDYEITQYSGNHINNEEEYKKYIFRTLQVRTMKQGYPFIVIDKNSDRVAGTTRLGFINFESKRLEIGWTWYGKQFRGNGINLACKYELLKFAFETLDFRRVQFSVDTENIRSQKAVLKLGAKQEGIFRHNYINAIGESRNDIYYSIIKPEWNDIKATIFKEFSM